MTIRVLHPRTGDRVAESFARKEIAFLEGYIMPTKHQLRMLSAWRRNLALARHASRKEAAK